MKVIHKRQEQVMPDLNKPAVQAKMASRHPEADGFAETWKSVLKHTMPNGELHQKLMLTGPHFVKLFKEQATSAATASAIASFASFGTNAPKVALDDSLASSELATILNDALALVK